MGTCFYIIMLVPWQQISKHIFKEKKNCHCTLLHLAVMIYKHFSINNKYFANEFWKMP